MRAAGDKRELVSPWDIPALREHFFSSALEGLSGLFPIENERYVLDLEDVGYRTRKFSKRDEYEAVTSGKTLALPLQGTWTLKNKATNEVQRRRRTLAQIPYLTDRGTFVFKGSDFSFSNQLRLKPGVYTRTAQSGLLDAVFNTEFGNRRRASSFRVQLDPATGDIRFVQGQSHLKFYPLLKSMGVPDEEIAKWLGNDYLELAQKTTDPRALVRIAGTLLGKRADENTGRELREYFRLHHVDPDIAERATGIQDERVSPAMLLATARRLLEISRGNARPFSRDALFVEKFYRPGDQLKFRLQRDVGRNAANALWKATNQGSPEAVPTGLFSPLIRSLFFKSGLAMPPTETNPIEVLDNLTRVVRTGEYGLRQMHATPEEARYLQPSHHLFIDPVRGPEGIKLGLDMRLARGVKLDKDGNLHAPMRNAKTGKVEYVAANDVKDLTIGLAGEEGKKNPLAIINGDEEGYARPEDVDYYAVHGEDMFSLNSNLVPGAGSVKHGRLLMGSKYSISGDTFVLIRHQDGSFYYGAVESYTWVRGDTSLSIDQESKKICWKPVHAVSCHLNNCRMYRIELKSGRSVTSTECHSFVTMGRDGNLQEIATENLVEGTPIPRIGQIELEENNSEISIPSGNKWNAHPGQSIPLDRNFGWVIGLYLSEGCLISRKGRKEPSSINFALSRKELLQRLETFFSSFRIHVYPTTSTDGHQLKAAVVHWTRLACWLKDNFKTGSYAKSFPGWIFGAPREFLRGLISGYLDGDGSVTHRRKRARVNACTRSKSLRDGLALILSMLGIDTTIRTYFPGYYSPSRPLYSLEIRCADMPKLPSLQHIEKNAKIEQALEWSGRKSGDWVPVYPELRGTILSKTERKSLLRQKLYIGATSYGQYSREQLTALVEEESESEKWVQSSVRWDWVTKIEEVDSAIYPLVYDLHMDDAVFMTGEGIFVHNSSQALPLTQREAPLVQSLVPETSQSFESLLGEKAGALRSQVEGTVIHVGADAIKVRDTSGEDHEFELYHQLPLNKKSFIEQTPEVSVGHHVIPGDILASSNFTDKDGTLATGINLRTAFIPEGDTYEDAVYISEAAAKRLTSLHMIPKSLDKTPETVVGYKSFISIFPSTYNKTQLDRIDEDGLIRPGSHVEQGDPLMLSLRKRLRRPYYFQLRKGVGDYANETVTWDHSWPGMVTDSRKTADGWQVFVRSEAPAEAGDKLAIRMGGKGIIARVRPTESMPKTSDGEAVELVLSPDSILSRGNPGVFAELLLGKAAKQRGEPYKIPMFSKESLISFALQEVKKLGVDPFEKLYNGETGRAYSRPMTTGYLYAMKLHHMTEEKTRGRGTGRYTSAGLPGTGGQSGSKKIGSQAFAALLSSGCLLGNTTVLTEEEGWLWISHIVKRRLKRKVACVDAAGNLVFRPITNWFCRAADPADIVTLKVTVTDPEATHRCKHRKRAINITKNHEVYTPNGKITAGELKSGDKVGIADTTLQPWQEKIAYGTLMGDASGRTNAGLSIAYGPLQFDYVDWLVEKFSNLHPHAKVSRANSGGFSTKPCKRLRLRKHWRLTEIVEEFYDVERVKHSPDDVIKKMDWIGLGVWFADDGTICAPSGQNDYISSVRFCTHCFSEAEVESLAKQMREFTGMPWRTQIQKKKYRDELRTYPCLLLTNGDGAQNNKGEDYVYRFLEMLAPYIPSPVSYKIRDRYPCGGYVDHLFPESKLSLGFVRIDSIEPYKSKAWDDFLVYNLTVDEHHNYLASGLVVGNSTDFLEDAWKVRGSRNDAYWQAMKLGQTPPVPRIPYIHRKYIDMLKGSGINVRRVGSQLHIMPMTDKDTLDLSRGEIQSSDMLDRKTLKPKAGGLFDPTITEGAAGQGWGHWTLPMSLPNPVMEPVVAALLGIPQKDIRGVLTGEKEYQNDTGPSAIAKGLSNIDTKKEITRLESGLKTMSATASDKAIKKLKYLRALDKYSIAPSDLMISTVPVIPPMARPISQVNDLVIVSDPNYLYKDLIDLTKEYKRAKESVPPSMLTRYVGDAYDSVKAVFGLGEPVSRESRQKQLRGLLGLMFGGSRKGSLLLNKVVGRPMDYSGLAVITPNSGLDMDHVGMPERTAWDVYRPFIIRRLVQDGLKPVQAVREAAEKTNRARDAMVRVMGERPVIVNRAPTLHKFGMMAFYPVLTKGETMEMSPAVVPAMGGDFDGDTVMYHVPVSQKAVREAETMLPSQNLYTMKTRKIHYIPVREFLQGLYLASRKSKKHPHVFRSEDEALQSYRKGQLEVDRPIRIVQT